MNREVPQTHPPLASRSGAEASDPVLAALPSRFSFGSAQGVGVARVLIAVLGISVAAAGIFIVIGEQLPVAVGVALIVVGALMVAPLIIKALMPNGGQWSETESGASRRLAPVPLRSDGGEVRAAELYRIFTTEHDSDRWPQLDLQLPMQPETPGDVVVTVYRRHGGGALLTVRTETDAGARSWPLIEPTAADTTAWLRRIAPKPDSSSDQAANTPYLYD